MYITFTFFVRVVSLKVFLIHGIIEYDNFKNRFIWSIDGILKGTTPPVKKGSRSNDNSGVLHTPQISSAGNSPSDADSFNEERVKYNKKKRDDNTAVSVAELSLPLLAVNIL